MTDDDYKELKNAVIEANKCLMAGEGIDLLYYWDKGEYKKLRDIIAKLIEQES